MRRLYFTSSLLPFLLCVSISTAQNLETKFGGNFNFASGFVVPQQNDTMSEPFKVTDNNGNYGFISSANIYFEAKYQFNEDIEYGTKISVQPTTKNARAEPSLVYFESSAGRIEFGSNKSSYGKLGISGTTLSCSDDWSTFLDIEFLSKNNINYITSGANFLDTLSRTSGQTEYSRKVNYYTPEINGIKFGVTYIPDTSNTGHGSIGTKTLYSAPYHFIFTDKDGENQKAGIEFALTNALAGGLLVKQELNSGVKVEGSIVAEIGTTVNSVVKLQEAVDKSLMSQAQKDVFDQFTFNNLLSWKLGVQLSYNDFSVAGSYTNLGDSLQPTNESAGVLESYFRDPAYFYSCSGKYKLTDEAALSLSYFASSKNKNTANTVTGSGEYKLSEECEFYVELSRFWANGSIQPLKQDATLGTSLTDDIAATIFLVGTKISL